MVCFSRSSFSANTVQASRASLTVEESFSCQRFDTEPKRERNRGCRMTALQSNSTLCSLNLARNSIKTPVGIQHLAAALRSNSTLTSLDMTGNRNEIEAWAPFATALQFNSGLRRQELTLKPFMNFLKVNKTRLFFGVCQNQSQLWLTWAGFCAARPVKKSFLISYGQQKFY